MRLRSIARRSISPVAVLLVAAGLYGCGQQQLPADSAAAPEAQSQPRSQAPARAYTPPRETPVQQTSHVTVPQGTEVHMTLTSAVSSKTSQVGDPVSGTTTSAVIVGDSVAIPAGSTLQGRVTGVDPATTGLKVKEKGGGLVLSFSKVTVPNGATSTMSGSLTSVASSSGKTAGIIGGSAAGGAILGKILGGHTKDAAIGAVVGGGIGTGIAAGTKGKEMVIPAGTAVAVTLDQPLTLQRS
jgi:hypothetical protein